MRAIPEFWTYLAAAPQIQNIAKCTKSGKSTNKDAAARHGPVNPEIHPHEHEEWVANFTEMNLAKVALQNGVADATVTEWRRQLKEAEQEGRFSFTVIGVVTTGYRT